MDFELEIQSLIDSHNEGAYWDFKLQWPTTEGGSLLHDIICMSNNLEDRDAYIIIGIRDETCEIEGVRADDKNRKNTQQLNNYLKDKPFAGNIRPLTEVRSFDIGDKTIDIIIIKRCMKTPLYLTSVKSDYRNLYPYHIYTRVVDSNTEKNGSADIDKVESLWRKRFGIDKTPLERLDFLLMSPEKWVDCPYLENKNSYLKIKYHEDFPEFTIRIRADDSGNAQELYMGEFLNPTPLWTDVYVYYHDTVLRYFKGVELDGGVSSIVAPECCVSDERINGKGILFHYYIKNSTRYLLSLVLGGIASDLHFLGRFEAKVKTILIFEDEQEFSLFKDQELNGKDSIFPRLSPEALNEISMQSTDRTFISSEIKNKELMSAHLKFTLWAKRKLEEFRKKRHMLP